MQAVVGGGGVGGRIWGGQIIRMSVRLNLSSPTEMYVPPDYHLMPSVMELITVKLQTLCMASNIMDRLFRHSSVIQCIL